MFKKCIEDDGKDNSHDMFEFIMNTLLRTYKAKGNTYETFKDHYVNYWNSSICI